MADKDFEVVSAEAVGIKVKFILRAPNVAVETAKSSVNSEDSESSSESGVFSENSAETVEENANAVESPEPMAKSTDIEPAESGSRRKSNESQEAFCSSLYPCIYSNQGCEKKLKLENMYEHMKFCVFVPKFKCVVPGNDCHENQMSTYELVKHLVESHQVFLHDLPYDFDIVVPNVWEHEKKSLPRYYITNVLLYEKTILLVAYRRYRKDIIYWLWDVDNVWARKRLKVITRMLPSTAFVNGSDGSPNSLYPPAQVGDACFLVPVPFQVLANGEIKLPRDEEGVQSFLENDICREALSFKGPVDWFKVQMQLF